MAPVSPAFAAGDAKPTKNGASLAAKLRAFKYRTLTRIRGMLLEGELSLAKARIEEATRVLRSEGLEPKVRVEVFAEKQKQAIAHSMIKEAEALAGANPASPEGKRRNALLRKAQALGDELAYGTQPDWSGGSYVPHGDRRIILRLENTKGDRLLSIFSHESMHRKDYVAMEQRASALELERQSLSEGPRTRVTEDRLQSIEIELATLRGQMEDYASNEIRAYEAEAFMLGKKGRSSRQLGMGGATGDLANLYPPEEIANASIEAYLQGANEAIVGAKAYQDLPETGRPRVDERIRAYLEGYGQALADFAASSQLAANQSADHPAPFISGRSLVVRARNWVWRVAGKVDDGMLTFDQRTRPIKTVDDARWAGRQDGATRLSPLKRMKPLLRID